MDFCDGGDLAKRISCARELQQPLSEDQVLRWYVQGLLGLKYIHDKHVLHRDIKSSNFFISRDGDMKMGDFGIAKILACTVAVAKTQIGTPYYLSPEVCQGQPYAWPSDVWAYGVVLYEMCALDIPFSDPAIEGLVRKILGATIPALPHMYSRFMDDLCKEMLERSAEKRVKCSDILQRPRIQACIKNLLEEVHGRIETGPTDLSCEDQGVEQEAAELEGPYASTAGFFRENDLVEYNSASHLEWIPAKVVEVDGNGNVVLDAESAWISKEDQAVNVRPRSQQTGEVLPGLPYVGCPSAVADFDFNAGDLAEYWSVSHNQWLPATITSVEADGSVMIDLKPGTWISKQEQATRIRPRR